MPKATVSTESHHVELVRLPGGYVDVRQLSHGQRLHRQDIAAKLSFAQRTANKIRNGMGASELNEDDSGRTEVELMQLHARQYEYTRMIVSHNLEEDDGTLFNFNDITAFDRLAPQIGEEIDEILDDMNAGKIDPNASKKPSEQTSLKEVTS